LSANKLEILIIQEAYIMKLVPLADRVVLKQLEAEEKTKSGIILSSGSQERPLEAEVIAVGPGTDDVKMELKEGDKVFYSKYAGSEVKFEGEEYIILKQSDVLAVIR
jgi:chaperonin GroES